jgi:hypothetical protein
MWVVYMAGYDAASVRYSSGGVRGSDGGGREAKLDGDALCGGGGREEKMVGVGGGRLPLLVFQLAHWCTKKPTFPSSRHMKSPLATWTKEWAGPVSDGTRVWTSSRWGNPVSVVLESVVAWTFPDRTSFIRQRVSHVHYPAISRIVEQTCEARLDRSILRSPEQRGSALDVATHEVLLGGCADLLIHNFLLRLFMPRL